MRGARAEEFHTSPATPNAGEPTPMYVNGGRGGGWKKGVGVRPWLMFNTSGEADMAEASKHTIMQQTGIPARDLRMLDPLLSYPSSVLGREKAIVINLEHIKALITAQEVLLLNSEDPSVSPFIMELKKCIRKHHQKTTKPQEEENYEGEAYTRINQDGSKVPPFEFVALEACLKSASSSLEDEALSLESEAHPAMEKLTSKISSLNLERVRQIKSRLVAITGRVQKVRDEIEHLLDDDEDMAEMYLTEKLAHKLEHSSTSSMNGSDAVEVDLPDGDLDDRLPPEFASEDKRDESYLQENDANELLMSARSALTTNSRGTHTSSTRNAMRNKSDVRQLERILEAYFVQIDSSLNKLLTLREYVDDTEDYINIMLNDKQNRLLQMGVKLAKVTLVMSLFIAVAGVFGMNINIELFNDEKAGPGKFLWTVIASSLGCVFLYSGAMGWCKSKGLLE